MEKKKYKEVIFLALLAHVDQRVALGLAKWISSGLQKDSLPYVSMLSGADRACVVRRSQPTGTAVVPTVEHPFYPLSDHRHLSPKSEAP